MTLKYIKHLCFNMAIAGLLISPVSAQVTEELISWEAMWRYQDYSIGDVCPNLDSTGWQENNFNDAGWNEGNAELGYGETSQNTTLDFGPNPANKCITYYFRHQFNVTNASTFSALTLGLVRDDGAVVYLNGHEVVRSNMPVGNINHATLAAFQAHETRYVANEREPLFYSIPASTLLEGTNVIAVEVHQVDLTSSDLNLDLNLVGIKNGIDNAAVTEVDFAVIGDFGLAEDPWEENVANLVKSKNPDFVVAVGDNNLGRGQYDQDDVDTCSYSYAPYWWYQNTTMDENIGQFYHEYIGNYHGDFGSGSAYNRFFPALGNHDWDPVRYGGNFLDSYSGAVEAPEGCQVEGLFPTPHHDYFTLPGNELYYVFRWGPVEFFVVDMSYLQPDNSPDPTVDPIVHGADNLRQEDSSQALWLKAALSASQAPWKFVVLHHSPYTTAFHANDDGIENTRWPFEAWGAHAIFAGHNHLYERLQWGGIPLFVNGLGGDRIASYACGQGTLPPGDDVSSEFCFDKDSIDEPYGALFVEVDTSSAAVEFRSIDDVQRDVHTIGPAVPAMIIDNADGGFSSGPSAWPRSSFTPGHYGSDYQYASPDSGGKWAMWTFNGVPSGSWDIYAQWPGFDNRSPAAPYTIRNNGSVVCEDTFDQTLTVGDWYYLCTFDAAAGTVTAEFNDSPLGYVIADAVKLACEGGGPGRILDYIEIEGPAAVDENSSEDYICRAYYDDGTDAVVTAESWTETCTYGDIEKIGALGRLSTELVDADENCQVVASYSEGGVDKTNTHDVTILDNGSVPAMIIDNADGGFSSGPSAWPRSSFTPGHYGSDYQYASPDSGGKWAMWTFNGVPSGSWDIYAQWPGFDNRSPAAPYTIRNNGSVVCEDTFDQTLTVGDWYYLCTFDAAAGTVTAEFNDSPLGYVIADALKLELHTP